jgi:BRCT domain type II-containing protein
MSPKATKKPAKKDAKKSASKKSGGSLESAIDKYSKSSGFSKAKLMAQVLET